MCDSRMTYVLTTSPITRYQEAAVKTFFALHDPPYPYYSTKNNISVGANGGLYNRAGRGFPDLSAVGEKYLFYSAGRDREGAGTSVSAPLFASMLTRINEERILANKSTVGFVNPTLYAHPEAFHDIIVGNNPGCGSQGFNCTPG